MNIEECRPRSPKKWSSISRERQAVRMRAYQEAMDALSKQKYEEAKMQAGVRAFVEGSKKKADVHQYLSEEARLNMVRERAERDKVRNSRERRVCAIAIALSCLSVVMALLFIVTHR